MDKITDIADFEGRSWREDADDTHSSSSAAPRRHAFGNSTLSVKDGIWHLRVQEPGYRENGLAVRHQHL
jgi:hypothetical protein